MKIREYVLVTIALLLISVSYTNTERKKVELKCNIEFTYERANGDNLRKEFEKEYSSWGTSFQNVITLRWKDALQSLSEQRMRELCICFHAKIYQNQPAVELYENSDEKVNHSANQSYATLKIKEREKRLRKYSCRDYFYSSLINLLSGYRNYGFSKRYDVYVVSRQDFNVDNVVGVGRTISL